MFSKMAFDENVAPDTPSTFMAKAWSTVLPCQRAKSSFALSKKSGVSELGNASIFVTMPLLLMCMRKGTGPPYPDTSLASGLVLTTMPPSGRRLSVSPRCRVVAAWSCVARKS